MIAEEAREGRRLCRLEEEVAREVRLDFYKHREETSLERRAASDSHLRALRHYETEIEEQKEQTEEMLSMCLSARRCRTSDEAAAEVQIIELEQVASAVRFEFVAQEVLQ